MADLIDVGERPEAVSGWPFVNSGQSAVYGGGGLRGQLVPLQSENEVRESIQHQAVVPIFFALNDGSTLERYPTNDSFAMPNQPVLGGLSAPGGLIPPDISDSHYDTGQHQPSEIIVAAPQAGGSSVGSFLSRILGRSI